MNAYIAKLVAQRIALGLLLIFLVSIMIFLGTQILPGDVAQAILVEPCQGLPGAAALVPDEQEACQLVGHRRQRRQAGLKGKAGGELVRHGVLSGIVSLQLVLYAQ